MNKKLPLLIVLTSCALVSKSQIRINEPSRVIERQAENRANRKVDQAVDKGFDKVEEGIGSLFKKKIKRAKKRRILKNRSLMRPKTAKVLMPGQHLIVRLPPENLH